MERKHINIVICIVFLLIATFACTNPTGINPSDVINNTIMSQNEFTVTIVYLDNCIFEPVGNGYRWGGIETNQFNLNQTLLKI